MAPSFPPHSRGTVVSILPHPPSIAYGAITLFGAAFQQTSTSPGRAKRQCCNPTSPPHLCGGFGLLCAAFTRCYSRHPGWFLLSRLLRRFNSPHFRSSPIAGLSIRQEVPFGHLRFKGRMRLAGAYRSLPRPSSALEPSHPPGSIRAAI